MWAKLVKDGKIIKQLDYARDDKFTYSRFFEYLSDICEELDVATPVLLKTHIFNYAKFGQTRFIARDFTETPDFDKLEIVNVSAR